MKIYGAVLAIAAILAGCAHREVGSAHVGPDVATSVVREGYYDDTVAAVGRIGGTNAGQTNLAFLVPGSIARIDVRVGDRVSAGQPLAELDRGGYSLMALQASDDANVAAANARASRVDRYGTQLSVDEAALERAESLYRVGVSPRKDVDAARAQLARDRADAAIAQDQVSSTQSSARSARMHEALADRDLQNTTLRAPSDGVVSAILRRVGESVDPSVGVMTLSDAQPSEVSLSVAGTDLARVRVGNTVSFKVLGSNISGQGTVQGVSNGIDPVTQTGTVVVGGLPTDAPTGSTVDAKIVVGRTRGIVVPETAVVQDPQSGNAVVFVAAKDNDGNASFRQAIVRVASHNGSEVLVASGLRVGERIASQGGFTLLAPADSGGD